MLNRLSQEKGVKAVCSYLPAKKQALELSVSFVIFIIRKIFFQLFDLVQYSGIDETDFSVKLISVLETNFSTSI